MDAIHSVLSARARAISSRALIMLSRTTFRLFIFLLAFVGMTGGAQAAPTFAGWTTTISGATDNIATVDWNWSYPGYPDIESYEFGIAINYNPAQLSLTLAPVPPGAWGLYPADPFNVDTGPQPYLTFAGPSQYLAFYDVEGIGCGGVCSGDPFDPTGVQAFSMTFEILSAPAGPWTSDDITVSFIVDGAFPDATSSAVTTISRDSDFVLAVPEPGAIWMLLAGLGLLGFSAGRKHTRRA